MRGTSNGFVDPKAALVVAGGAVLAVAAAVTRLGHRRVLPRGVALPLAALLAWSAVAAAASPWRRLALVGHFASRHGLLELVAFAGVLMGTAAVTRGSDVRRTLAVLWFGAGSVVLGYGLLQLHDRLTTWGGTWDPLWWPPSSFGHTIWSTLGNPDDLAGFLAILLPVGAVLWADGARWRRWVSGVMLAALLVELAATSGRAAWVGAGAAAVVLLAGGRPGRRAVAVLAAGGAAVVAVTVALAVTGNAKYDLGALAATGPGTTVDQRVELWRAAGRMAVDRPLVGIGPDAFGPALFEYRSDRFVQRFGALTTATDPHDVVATWLATTGVPGLAAFSWLVVAVAMAVRRIHPAAPDAVLALGLAAALVAWLVESLGYRQSLALDLCAWALAGLALAPGAWRDGSGAQPGADPAAEPTGDPTPAPAAVTAGAEQRYQP